MDSGELRTQPAERGLFSKWPPAAPAVAVAAATLLLLCTAAAQTSAGATLTARLGAFMAGAVLLSVVFGMVVQERRDNARRARWNLELDRHLSEATRELQVRVEELAAYAAVARQSRAAEGVADLVLAPELSAGECGAICLGPAGAATRSVRGPARPGRTPGLLPSTRLSEEVQRVIRTYPLPVQYPWEQFERFVGDEIDRCRSLMIMFSIIEIRMEDYATAQTDTHGRGLALRRAVHLLQASLRRVDILSSDGAGRFAMVLPRVPKVHALDKARELVARLATDDVAASLLRCERLALSAGVASFPDDGAKAHELLAGIGAAVIRSDPSATVPGPLSLSRRASP